MQEEKSYDLDSDPRRTLTRFPMRITLLECFAIGNLF
jgi:hypothetical protein